MWICVYVGMCVNVECLCVYPCEQVPDKGTTSLGVGVTGVCEQPTVDSGD